MQLTNPREIASFFLARVIVVAIYFVMTPWLLSPLYLQLFRTGGAALVTTATTGVSFVTWLLTLLLFLALRGGFAGVPPMVAANRRSDAVTSSAAEISAFLIAVVIVMAALWIVTVFVLAGVYASLRQSGGILWITPVAIAVAAAASVVFFLIFIGLRGAMSPPVSPDMAIEAYDDGGASMGFGWAIATCLRKYAVFSGRASRSEYWFFVLFETLLFAILIILGIAAFRALMNVLLTLAVLILFLPRLAALARRLHDTGRSAWWILIPLVPIIGSVWLIVILCQRGTDGANRYGIGPAQAAIPEVFA